MDLNRYVETLRRQLATAAAAGGDEARELADRLTAPLDSAARLVLLDALSDAVGEISADLAPGAVDLRLRGGSPEFVVTPALPSPSSPAAPAMHVVPALPAAPAAETSPEDTSTTRTTLRLPDRIKAQVEVAAARDGVSVNTWLVRAVSAALEQPARHPAEQSRPSPGRRGAGRVTGWVR
ncbi:histidine kinase [Isoptericola sp. NEAU-Y5]|uniref:Histidine kinase n=1 Tax=Isoptericola luteus TaxID=2879484 RepID=A0ABS7ZC15_9MICO|nr:histidine kinase [Isoptericola sp. NEAU-Y5]MCA5892002.1 histidine kinase [Isoptericola sp. NEAU-Y5]